MFAFTPKTKTQSLPHSHTDFLANFPPEETPPLPGASSWARLPSFPPSQRLPSRLATGNAPCLDPIQTHFQIPWPFGMDATHAAPGRTARPLGVKDCVVMSHDSCGTWAAFRNGSYGCWRIDGTRMETAVEALCNTLPIIEGARLEASENSQM
jgi:hypothetical protein